MRARNHDDAPNLIAFLLVAVVVGIWLGIAKYAAEQHTSLGDVLSLASIPVIVAGFSLYMLKKSVFVDVIVLWNSKNIILFCFISMSINILLLRYAQQLFPCYGSKMISIDALCLLLSFLVFLTGHH